LLDSNIITTQLGTEDLTKLADTDTLTQRNVLPIDLPVATSNLHTHVHDASNDSE